MIKILMLDLDNTLAQGASPAPHVLDALTVLKDFETEEGDPLTFCLISDDDIPQPSAPEKIDSAFHHYVQMLADLNLKQFFEPVEKHVTLATQAGARKPDRRIFDLAIKRLGLRARLNECLLISEDAEHLNAGRKSGMVVLRFDPAGKGDFSDWSEAPLLIARRVAPDSLYDLQLALKLWLSAAHEIDLISISNNSTVYDVGGRAKKFFQVTVPTRSGGKERIEVPSAVNIMIKLDKEGRVKSIKSEEPDPEALAESAHFVKTLEDNRQVARQGEKLKPDQTHAEEVDEKGRKRLKRKRFTAI